MTKLLEQTLFENVAHSNEEFTKHFHDTYTIGITYEGVIKTFINSTFYESYEYSIRINNPGEVHCGTSEEWSHANFYPSVDLLANIYEGIFHEKRVPFFENHIIKDKELFLKIDRFFRSYFNHDEAMQIESNLIDALSSLVLNHTNHTNQYKEIFDHKRIVKDTFELIKDCIDNQFTLESLAQNVNLSKYHFLRVFKKEFGMTPHAFIVNERLNQAERLIQKGVPISEASVSVGFNDQSHFSRNFKKFYGYTPKNLKKNSNIVL